MRREGPFFPAVLKTPDGQWLADGLARICAAERWVEIRSQFVPLLPLGAQAVVCRLTGQEESHRFMGKVYLSSPTLLRIVEVEEALLAEAELELPQPVCLEGWVSPAAGEGPRARVDLFSLSLSQVRFTSTQPFQEGQALQLEIQSPSLPLAGVGLQVARRLLFGVGKSSYRCRITSLPPHCRAQLASYLAQGAHVFDDGGPPAG